MLPELLCILSIHGIGKALNTQTGKNSADEWGMYRDGNGQYRLKKNGRKVVDTNDDNGDYIIKYVSDGTTAVKITKIKAKEREEEAKKQGKRFYLRQKDIGFHGKLGEQNIVGERYCEVGKPTKYFVKRTIVYNSETGKGYAGEFYMDMKCNLICPTEEQIQKDKELYTERTHEHGLLSDDNTELYDAIMQEWEQYLKRTYISAKHEACVTIGQTNKNNYKFYSDKINRWR